jgi:hypothetical protein
MLCIMMLKRPKLNNVGVVPDGPKKRKKINNPIRISIK